MKAKKIFGLLAAGMMALPLLFGAMGAGNVVDAAEVPKDVNVTLHKRVFEDEMPSNTPNTGKEIPNFGGKALNGVTFTAFDVTNEYYSLFDETDPDTGKKYTIDGAIKYIQDNKEEFNNTPKMGSVETTGGTESSPLGQAKFENLPLTKIINEEDEPRDAVYLFLETGAPANVKQYAQPIVLAMPIYTVATDGNPSVLNTDIHLYPKNVTMEDTKEITNIETITVNGKEIANVEIGQEIEYEITVGIPDQIGQYDNFTIEDLPAAGLVYKAGSISIKDEDGTAIDEYDTTIPDENKGGFLVTFDMTDAGDIKSAAGKNIIISYTMILTADIDLDEVIDNNVEITLGTISSTIPGPGVTTGGHKFEKTDAHTGAGLAGAEFVVKNGDDKYAVFGTSTTGEYTFTGVWADSKNATGTKITSGPAGVLNIKGFKNGNYFLEETKAPEGYVLLTEDVEFEVEHGKYGDTTLATNVANTPKGLLPSTGGNGIFAFLAIGLGLMLGAFVWYKNSKKQAQV